MSDQQPFPDPSYNPPPTEPPPAPPYAAPAQGYPMPAAYPGYQAYPEQSQATTVLVLGLLGIITCAILSPFAWVMGNTELEAIDAGRRPPHNRSTANAGRILGIIGSVLAILSLVAAIVGVIAFFAIAGAAVSSG